MKNWTRITIGVLAAFALALSACGGSSEPTQDLSPLAAEGREIALSRGCSACHGQNGEGTIAPAWMGLAGSTVALDDGTTVVADTEYLRRAMVDPQAEIVADVTITMPVTDLSEDEIVALIAYIEELK